MTPVQMDIVSLKTTPGISAPGSWLFFLLRRVTVLGQASEQVGIVWAGHDALAIQGIIADGVGEGRRGLVCRIRADGVGRCHAGAARYVVVHYSFAIHFIL